jgi:hypothetical protein
LGVHDGDPPFVGRNGAEVFTGRIRPVSKVNHTSFPPKSSRPSFASLACNFVRSIDKDAAATLNRLVKSLASGGNHTSFPPECATPNFGKFLTVLKGEGIGGCTCSDG